MAQRRRRSSRRRRARRWPFLVGSALFAVALALAIMFADLPHRPAGGAVPVPHAAADAPGDADTAPADRLVYPYSIVAGGIVSVEELREQIARDPVVAAHYRDFDLSKARIERLKTPRVAHVSYRMNDAVYWTRKPVVVPAGELIVTDGEHEARTRCANQLALDPGPVSDDEPDPDVLDTPRLPLRPLGLVPAGIGAHRLNGAVPAGTPGPDGVIPSSVMPALQPSAGTFVARSVSSNPDVPAVVDPPQAPVAPLTPQERGANPAGPKSPGPNPPNGPPFTPPPGPPGGPPNGPPFSPPHGPPLGPPFGPPFDPPFHPPIEPPDDPPYDPPGPDGDPGPPIREVPEPGLTVLMLALAAAAARVRRRAASRA